jgi:hypothetical protein
MSFDIFNVEQQTKKGITVGYKYIYIILVKICFDWFYSTPTQFRSHGTETGKMILAYLGCYKLKAEI